MPYYEKLTQRNFHIILLYEKKGQHIRHSMDHIELAALIAQQINHHSLSNSTKTLMMSELHYDLRVRGGTVETDINESRKRIESVMNVFDELQIDDEQQEIQNIPINAYFMLSSSPKEGESQFQSTIGRELGFVAHHAIHHMAMVKVIALHSIGFTENELPTDFGRAPSTVQHDLSSNNEK